MARKVIREREIREDEFGEAMPAAATGWAVAEDGADVRPMAAAIITWVAIVAESLLLVRLMLRLFAANPSNGFVAAVYDLSRPLVSPFFGALGVELNTGPGAFETATFLAMLVYGIIAYLIVAGINAATRRRI